MKKMIPNALDRKRALVKHLAEREYVAHVSDAKRDGTVIVRFLSCDAESATEAVERWGRDLTERGAEFTQVDDNKIRLALP